MGRVVSKALMSSYVTPGKSWIFLDRKYCKTVFFVISEHSLTVCQILNRLNCPVFSSALVFVVQLHSIFWPLRKQNMYLFFFFFSCYFSVLFLYAKQITVQQFDYGKKSKKLL